MHMSHLDGLAEAGTLAFLLLQVAHGHTPVVAAVVLPVVVTVGEREAHLMRIIWDSEEDL